jgi:hypothetical protein
MYTVVEDKTIYIEQCKLGTDECTVMYKNPEPATAASGDPNYFQLIINPDENPDPNKNVGIKFSISKVPQESNLVK